jgi:uncharacterized circularly permuted ATP-grasp superfamily protein/uncharacterized alpha-E superfamily protein
VGNCSFIDKFDLRLPLCKAFFIIQPLMIKNPDPTLLIPGYSTDDLSYNELLNKENALYPHWQNFFRSFDGFSHEQLLEKKQDIFRYLKENGVTYNIHGDTDSLNRPWNLDLIPFIIGHEEWAHIEKGLIQRANLFNLLLKDIYGGQSLIKKGLLPMELIYHHAGFIRECAALKSADKNNLILYSADLARSPDGKIWVVNDRTQAPSGSGYALENRMAMARILPEFFEGFKVNRLSSYFNALRAALNDSVDEKIYPRIVVLTPGPKNETYFEHSYLSSYLGYTLVQGDDLMVKDNQVWLKTISGLEKVDVILRRVDDVYCDPLELKEDSQLGVAGLLQVVRSGNVKIANPLGSGVLENPGFMPFLQNISKHLLGEDLLLPTVATWWCGQPTALEYVLDNFDYLLIKRINRNPSASNSLNAETLTETAKKELRAAILEHPHLYVAQEKINFSSAPSFNNDKVEPRYALIRSFLVKNNGSYAVMPGGLTRTSATDEKKVISNQLGGISKDTWIISPEKGTGYSYSKKWQSRDMDDYNVNSGILTSHTAESLYWVGRYAERILANARFMRTVIQFISEGDKQEAEDPVNTERILLEALTICTFTFPGFTGPEKENKFQDPWEEIADCIVNPDRPGSLRNTLGYFRQAVYSKRDHWSVDSWRVLRDMEDKIESLHTVPNFHHRLNQVLDYLVTSMTAFVGLNRESISRAQGWEIIDMGRKMEQALSLVNMMQAFFAKKHSDQAEYDLMETMLLSHDCLITYRYKYRAHLQFPLLLDLMLMDGKNPRSLLYQVERLKTYVEDLPKAGIGENLTEHDRLMLETFTLLRLADKKNLSTVRMKTGQLDHLNGFLSTIYTLLSATHDAVTKTYFKHLQSQKILFNL